MSDQIKIMWNFHRPCFFALEFPRDATVLWNSQGWSFVLSGISHGKVTNLKIPGVFSKKYVLNPPVWIFSGIFQ